jgi:hypothetical protein
VLDNHTEGMRPSRYSPSNSLPPVDVAGVITLDQVRLQPRKQNEYVDTPRSPHTSSGGKFGSSGNPSAKNTIVTLAPSRERVKLPNRTTTTTQSGIVRTQPVSISPPLKKDLPVEVDKGDSIICSQCGKCRCGACTSPRQLPSKWLCGDKVNVSPETCVDYVTCVCLVKGVFYHCSKDDQDAEFECVTDPCACCNRPNCCTRWTCILAMSLCLPCMCLYPPAKCGLMACTGLYNKCRKKGCTCNNKSSNQGGKKSRASKLTDSSSQYRGLLIESDRESSSVSNT